MFVSVVEEFFQSTERVNNQYTDATSVAHLTSHMKNKCEKSLEILLDKAIAEQDELKESVMSVMTHDVVADRMEGLLDDDVEIDRYQLGVTMIVIRKLLRAVLED